LLNVKNDLFLHYKIKPIKWIDVREFEDITYKNVMVWLESHLIDLMSVMLFDLKNNSRIIPSFL
jgi:hypothetical protein